MLREWPRGRVFHDGLHDEVLGLTEGGNYRKGKPWWLHWRHQANRKSVYWPDNQTAPPLHGADGRACPPPEVCELGPCYSAKYR